MEQWRGTINGESEDEGSGESCDGTVVAVLHHY
jgi:hypothetical protein